MKAPRFRLPRQAVAAEQAAAARYQLPAWLRGDVAGIVADLMTAVASKLRRVGQNPAEGHWHQATAELATYRSTVSQIGIIRRSNRTLREQARLIDALLAGAQTAVTQIRDTAAAEFAAACAAGPGDDTPAADPAGAAELPPAESDQEPNATAAGSGQLVAS